jgi:hypothetical protein
MGSGVMIVVLSRAYGSATNTNRFWTGWLDLVTPSCIISLNHNQFTTTQIYLQPNPSSLTAEDSLHSRSRSTTDSFHSRSRSMTDSFHSRSRSTTDSFLSRSRSTTDSFHSRSRSTTDSFHSRSRSTTDSFYSRSRSTTDSWVEVESYVTANGQSASVSWNKATVWGLRADYYYCQAVAGLLMWGAFSDERTDLSFKIAAGPRLRNHSRVRVPWDLATIFYYLRCEICLFVASYDSQGYGGNIWPRHHTGLTSDLRLDYLCSPEAGA